MNTDIIYAILGMSTLAAAAAAILLIINVAAAWIIFRKARQPGWASIVPFYNDYITYKIFWGNGWMFLLPVACTVLSLIPAFGVLLGLAALVIRALTLYKKSESFEKGIGFAVGLFFIEPVFNAILAFGGSVYKGVPQDGFSYDQLKVRFDSRKGTVSYKESSDTETAREDTDAVPVGSEAEETDKMR